MEATSINKVNTGPVPDSASAMMANRRLIIADHMCALPYGHNVGSILLFRQALAPLFGKTLCLVAKQLPKEIAEAKNFTPDLYYPYNTYIPIRFQSLLKKLFKTPVGFRDAKQILHGYELKMLLRSNQFWDRDVLLKKVSKNWEQVIETHNIGSNDFIFFPSTDYYGAITLLQLLIKRKRNLPQVHCRFIGVMENASHHTVKARAYLLAALRDAEAAGVRTSVSAEVPLYVEYLSNILQRKVFMLHHPLIENKKSMPVEKPFIASFIGQGRSDKGYFQIANIAQVFQQRFGSEVGLEVHDMGKNQPEYKYSYRRQLEVFPNLKILPAVLSEEEIHGMFQRASIVMAPYDPATYRLRGSAIFHEALAFGRPMITRPGVGFAPLVEKYGAGYLCDTPKEMADTVQFCMKIPPVVWEGRMTKARVAYTEDLQAGLGTLMQIHA